ncbi:hypothetical protein HAZT_HAZT011039 [Hyalella azteca]|uniref:Uncharacterized protein n=1 Tax=Hyalella azteca TaxID=294128 RepID=A0A6A0H9G6_HYAAZ|nr:hypothetical protein HAZT_HAZT011039 [Hyalella azteca]
MELCAENNYKVLKPNWDRMKEAANAALADKNFWQQILLSSPHSQLVAEETARVYKTHSDVWNIGSVRTSDSQSVVFSHGLLKVEISNGDCHTESKAQTERKSVFKEELEWVFDVAHKDAPSIMKIEEDIAFLVAQRQPGRPRYMGGIDAELAHKEERNCKRWQGHEERCHWAQQLSTLASTAMDPGDLSSTSCSAKAEEKEEFHVQQEQRVVGTSVSPPMRAKNVITPGLAASLDRTKLKADLKMSETVVMHYEEKLMQELTNKKHVDRLPVLVSGKGAVQLLGVPKLANGTGRVLSNAVVALLRELGIEDRRDADTIALLLPYQQPATLSVSLLDAPAPESWRQVAATFRGVLELRLLSERDTSLPCDHMVEALSSSRCLMFVVNILWPRQGSKQHPISRKIRDARN